MFGAWLVARLRQSVTLLRAQQVENSILLATVTAAAEELRAEAALTRFSDAVAEHLGSRRSELARLVDGRWELVADRTTCVRRSLQSRPQLQTFRDPAVEWRPDDVEEFLETIESQTDRVIALTSDLLQLSRLEAGAVAARLEVLDVSELLQLVARDRQNGERRVIVSSKRAVSVRADARLLQQAISNIVENADRYSIAGGSIRMDYSVRGHQVVIEITDEGPGIPAQDLPHVFNRFYRGVQAQRTAGTGLGLAITRALVELCGGTVEVSSSLMGTRFSISLATSDANA